MTEQPPERDQPVTDADHPAHVRTRPLARQARAPRVRPLQVLVAWLGAFAGIGLVVLLVELFPGMQLLLIGSFGASSVLLFAAPRAPFSQPRNLIGGHMISAIVGVACFRYLPDLLFIQASMAVATAIALMQVTRTLHPPGRFVEVFVDAPITVCQERDPKGLYAKARAGIIKEFTGISDPYEPPPNPEITVNSSTQTLEESTSIVLRRLEELSGLSLEVADRSRLMADLEAQLALAGQEAESARARAEEACVLAEVAELGDKLKDLQEALSGVQTELEEISLGIPNIPHESVPGGRSHERSILAWIAPITRACSDASCSAWNCAANSASRASRSARALASAALRLRSFSAFSLAAFSAAAFSLAAFSAAAFAASSSSSAKSTRGPQVTTANSIETLSLTRMLGIRDSPGAAAPVSWITSKIRLW